MVRFGKSFPVAVLLGAAVQTAAGQFQMTEIYVNAPGTDNGQEAIEITGAPGASLAGWSLIVIEGDLAPPGLVDLVRSLDTTATGSNGLLLLRDAASVILPAPETATSVVVADFAPDLENGSNTFLLGFGTPPAAGADLDTDDDGALDAGALNGFTVVDAVTFLENDGVAANFAYADDLGFPVLGPYSSPGPDFTPDALYRLFDAAGPTGTWVALDVLGNAPGPYVADFAGGEYANLPSCVTADFVLDLGSRNLGFAAGGCSLAFTYSAIDASAGGAQKLSLFAGQALGNSTYFVLGSVTGTAPGLTFPGGVNLPLNFDPYMNLTLTAPNTLITASNATLNGNGTAVATLGVPPGVVLPFPVTLNHAYIVLNAFNKVVFASNAAPLVLNP